MNTQLNNNKACKETEIRRWRQFKVTALAYGSFYQEQDTYSQTSCLSIVPPLPPANSASMEGDKAKGVDNSVMYNTR